MAAALGTSLLLMTFSIVRFATGCGALDQEVGELVADIGDDQLFELGRQALGPAERRRRLGARRRRRGREQPAGERVELLGLLLRRAAAPREGVAGRDQQRVGAVDAAGFDQQLERFVGLEAEHCEACDAPEKPGECRWPDYFQQFVSGLLTLTIS